MKKTLNSKISKYVSTIKLRQIWWGGPITGLWDERANFCMLLT